MTTSNLNADYTPEIAGFEQQLTQLANQLFNEFPCDGSRLGQVTNSGAQILADLPSSLHGFVTPSTSGLTTPPQSLASWQAAPVPSSFALPSDVNVQQLGALPHSLASLQSTTPPQGFVLPDEAQLQKLTMPRHDVGSLSTAPSAAPASSFYFLNEVKPLANTSSVHQTRGQHSSFDVAGVRRDFPILNERVNGHQLVWLDNAATTQKPKVVIDRVSYFYEHENSNIHRAAHELAARATDAYEKARKTVAQFINAPSPDNIIFVRGTTEAINLIAKSWGVQNIGKDDEIVIT